MSRRSWVQSPVWSLFCTLTYLASDNKRWLVYHEGQYLFIFSEAYTYASHSVLHAILIPCSSSSTACSYCQSYLPTSMQNSMVYSMMRDPRSLTQIILDAGGHFGNVFGCCSNFESTMGRRSSAVRIVGDRTQGKYACYDRLSPGNLPHIVGKALIFCDDGVASIYWRLPFRCGQTSYKDRGSVIW